MGGLDPTGGEYVNATKIIDTLLHPFTYASSHAAVLGGAQFLYSVFALSVVLYTYWHTKDTYPAGAAALVVSAAGLVFPELRLLGFVFLAMGAALIIYRLAREVV